MGMYYPGMPRAMTNADAFNAVAEPRRRQILILLADRERPVSAIVAALAIGQPSVSKHLRVLRDVGLVKLRRDGRRKLYRTNAAAIRPLYEWSGGFGRFWQQTLHRVKERAEAQGPKASADQDFARYAALPVGREGGQAAGRTRAAGNAEDIKSTIERSNGMSIAQTLISEFNEQAPLTRKFLERLPEDKLTWKPHEKSRTAGQLAMHLAQVPGSIARVVQENRAQAPDFASLMVQPATVREILAAHDEGVETVRRELAKFGDGAMREVWRLNQGDRELLACPREKFIRDIMLSHWYQHRGQFGVYLRLLNIAVPATWGPSADEAPAFLQKSNAV